MAPSARKEMDMIVYKAVRNMDGYHSWMGSKLGDLSCRYVVGKTTVPKAGVLYAFETPEQAFQFVEEHGSSTLQYVVLQCRARRSRRVARPMVNTSTIKFSDISSYLRRWWSWEWAPCDPSQTYIAPEGTVQCDSITPLNVVARKVST